jgi:cytochrome c oxidase assembly protein subunit 15
MRAAAVVGVLLLLIQALLGGLTVLYRLPDAVSTSHLGLAFLFLALATVLALTSSPSWEGAGPSEGGRDAIRGSALLAAIFTFVQSLAGAAVRHTDAGVACPDVPLCLGRLVPPLEHGLVVLHFGHRALGLVVVVVALLAGHLAFWKGGRGSMRVLGISMATVAVAQLLLGFLSVHSGLAVAPVSLHTLLAAILLTLAVSTTTLTWAPSRKGERGGWS